MSSHARFYIWFSDRRRFDIIELDGVSYTRQSASMFEIASGQRVSILVKTDSSAPASCTGAYIIAASDPRINAGTARCPMTFTRTDRPVQYVHGYLDVTFPDNQPAPNSKPRKAVLDPTSSTEVDNPWRFYGQTTATTSPAAPSATAGYVVTSNKWMAQRLELGAYWRMLYYTEPNAPNANTDCGYTTAKNRKISVPEGIIDAHDYEMIPTSSIAPWNPPAPTGGRSDYMHYIQLKETSNPQGFAAMTENPRNNIV